ncbi:MAG TPA: DnaA N-terminal domain-containing protein [Herpetosiphonaceae bacterium]
MSTARIFLPDIRYDPHETFEAFCARRQHALSEGRLAVRERRISGDLYLFYEHLVERVGANQYTWIGEDTLAETFRVDASTIKRWIAKLVRANLIRRQRQFATSSRTYITAYDRSSVVIDADPAASAPTTAVIELRETQDAIRATQVAEAAPIDSQSDQGTAPAAVSLWRRSAPTFGADLPRDPIKRSHLNPGGGRGSPQNQGRGTPEIRLLLEREGVTTFYLAPQLHQTPAEELRAVSRYLDHQPNVRDRARLFAALAVRGFGAMLLAGQNERRPQGSDRKRRPAPTGTGARDPLTYISGALAPLIMGGQRPFMVDATAPESSEVPQAEASNPDVQHTWRQVLGRLRQDLPASEIATWFTDATLLALDGAQAIVGVPNIFAREQLTRCYQEPIAQALATVRGYPVQVQIEIGGL